MKKTPFSCGYTPSFPTLLAQLKATLLISTYQAGKVVLLSATEDNRLIQLPRTFEKPMGIALHKNKMGIATKNEVIVLGNVPSLATTYPKKPNTYDGFFVPRATYYTGQVDIHDLDWGTDGLWAVNTSFSCLVLIDDNYSFVPKWKPHFITKLASEDRCHLNGMAMEAGKPTYVTALGKGDTPKSWRTDITKNGILMHVPSNEIMVESLAMPHSPRLYKDKLYILLSASGELIYVDTKTGKYELVLPLNAFVRGMCIHQDYAFIGTSKLRENSQSFQQIDRTNKANIAGILAVHLPSAKIVGALQYQSSVEEIYDVQLLTNLQRPNILNTLTEDHKLSLSTPKNSFWAKSKD